MPQATITHEGKEITVTLPDGWISPGQAPLYMLRAEAKQEQEQLRSTITTSALKSPEFRKEALSKWNVPLDENGQPLSPDKLATHDDTWRKAAEVRGVRLDEKGVPITKEVDLNQYRQSWESEHLKPVQEENQALKVKRDALLLQKFDTEMMRAASGRVYPELLKPTSTGLSRLAEMFKADFGYDEEGDYYAVRQGNTFRVSASPKEGRQWADATEFVAGLEKSGNWNHLFMDQRQRSSSYQNQGPISNRLVSREAFQNGQVNLEDIASGKTKVAS